MTYRKAIGKEYSQALDEIKSIVKQLGFTRDEIEKARKDLSKYMPKEVFLDKYGHQKGLSLLYALYAPQILRDYFQSSKESRRRRFEQSGARGALDFIQSVMMGYHEKEKKTEDFEEDWKVETEEEDSSKSFSKGILSVATPPTAAKSNPDVYDPTMGDKRNSTCPDCGVSFWAFSAGNGNPKYKAINGRPLSEWRDNANEAPEHIKINISTGERAAEGAGGYDFCGGRHEIFLISNPVGGLDIEKAESLSKQSFETLKAENRIRAIERNGALQYFLVDDKLSTAEQQLSSVPGGDHPFKTFNADWVKEEGGRFFRECRHLIDLKSPASVVRDRIDLYQPTGGRKSELVFNIDVYKCPKPGCPGQFYDTEGITKGKKGAKVEQVQCDSCRETFDITTLPEKSHYRRPWVHEHKSLDKPYSSSESEEGATLGDTITGGEDTSLLSVEMSEIINNLGKEIDEIGRSLSIKGSEKAKDIFIDFAVNGMGLQEITNKYFAHDYRLHFTECLDCGYRENEKSNPDTESVKRYERGLPVNMLECPRRKTDSRHKVETAAPIASKQEPTQESDWESFEEAETPTAIKSPTFEQKKKQEQVDNQAVKIVDATERRKFLGTNLVYHGRTKEEGDVAGISYLVDVANNTAEPLAVNDPRSYKGEAGKITRHIYAPAARILKAIVDALKNNTKIRNKYSEMIDVLNTWDERFQPHIAKSLRPLRRFCKTLN